MMYEDIGVAFVVGLHFVAVMLSIDAATEEGFSILQRLLSILFAITNCAFLLIKLRQFWGG